jgi:hypothetical protein
VLHPVVLYCTHAITLQCSCLDQPSRGFGAFSTFLRSLQVLQQPAISSEPVPRLQFMLCACCMLRQSTARTHRQSSRDLRRELLSPSHSTFYLITKTSGLLQVLPTSRILVADVLKLRSAERIPNIFSYQVHHTFLSS